jgi:formyltetrahydrofolate-dependent phosphoribosylglycinamide formyltransferase
MNGHSTPTARIAVLISGFGSNLQAIIDACDAGQLPARVVVVISNRKDAYGLVRAERAGIPAVYFPLKPYLQDGRGRRQYDADLAELVAGYSPDRPAPVAAAAPAARALAAGTHALSHADLQRFPDRVINLHPALPGQFPGTDAIARAYQAFREGRITHTGVLIHFVPDEGVDCGPVIVSEEVPIYPEDTLEALEARVHAVEHRLYVEALRRLIAGEVPPPK